jgi:NLI interacting factor-like phosphatase
MLGAALATPRGRIINILSSFVADLGIQQFHALLSAAVVLTALLRSWLASVVSAAARAAAVVRGSTALLSVWLQNDHAVLTRPVGTASRTTASLLASAATAVPPTQCQGVPLSAPSRTPRWPRLTVALDLDETLLAVYRLCAAPSGEQLTLRPLGTPVGSPYTISRRPPRAVAGLCDGLGASAFVTFAAGCSSSGGSAPLTLAVYERPGVRAFLDALSRFAEVVLCTAATRAYAQPLAALLDPDGTIFSAHVFGASGHSPHSPHSPRGGAKDLNRLGRDLARVVLVDNSLSAFASHPSNGLPCQPWRGGKQQDGQLLGVVLPLLVSLAQLPDVRPLLAAKFQVAEVRVVRRGGADAWCH